jgi:hypothetical protein
VTPPFARRRQAPAEPGVVLDEGGDLAFEIAGK